MAYFRAPKPETEKVNAHLRKCLEKLMADYQTLEKKAFCEHDWKMHVEEDYDGHRTDRHEVWTCTKCNL